MAKFIEYKASNDSGIAEVVANKGICWQVKDDAGDLFLVQKKHVVRGPWEETEEEEAAPVAAPLLTAALAQVAAPKPAAKPAAKVDRDPDLVTLKELCFQLDVEPRIARRRLRKAVGTIGTGSRWEWKKDSEELAKVRQALAGTMPADPEALSAADQADLNDE